MAIGAFRRCSQGYEAFIPHPFPPRGLVTWNNHLANELSRADRALGGLNAVDQLVPDIDFFISMYASQEATLSSQIEGIQATLGEYLQTGLWATRPDENSDVQEIANCMLAMNYCIKGMKASAPFLETHQRGPQKTILGCQGKT